MNVHYSNKISQSFFKKSDEELFKEIVDEMYSPANLDSLNEEVTVTIIPCSHKVQALALKNLKEQGTETCPQCKKSIKGYLTDSQVKKICHKLDKISAGFKINFKL